nr:hypothetical protein [Candidatus Sigynarchaeota archaeon]
MPKTNKLEHSEIITYKVEIGGNVFTADCLANDHDHPAMISVGNVTFSSVDDWVIKGMPEWVNIAYIIIRNSTFDNLKGLERFPRLENLWITRSVVGSMAGVEACAWLKYVRVVECHLDSMAWVAPLENIEVLDLTCNDIARVEGIAGKQHLRVLGLGKNRLTSTAGLDDLPAIRGIDISKNVIANIPNPVSMVTILGQCHRMHDPGSNGFNDMDNPIKEFPTKEGGAYFDFYFKQRFATLVPELENRLARGETVGMDFFKEGLRIEDLFYPWYGDKWTTPAIINSQYAQFFYWAERCGLDVNLDISNDYNNIDVLEMRPVEGSRIDLLISMFKNMVEHVP